MSKAAVITLTSHVARGGVGGRAVVFALERLGFPVWSVPTVTLAWHPGHGRATRLSPAPADFAALAADLAHAPALGEVGAVLSGYLGDASQASAVARLVAAVRSRHDGAHYLCDPVIGDHGGLFVPTTVAAAIRDTLVPLATILTPNRYELAWLTGSAAADNDALVAAARTLHLPEVVVTSAFAPVGETGALLVTPEGATLATHRALAAAPKGTGDLFAALYLGHRMNGLGGPDALQRATASVLRLVEIAVAAGLDELPLAAGQDALVAPPREVTLTPFA
jgi:pyridoxine kinase